MINRCKAVLLTVSTLVLFAPSVSAVTYNVDSTQEWNTGVYSNTTTVSDDLMLDITPNSGDTKVAFFTASNTVSFIDVSGQEELKYNFTGAENLADFSDVDSDGKPDIVYKKSGTIHYYDLASDTSTDTMVSAGSIGGVADIGSDGDMDVVFVANGDLKKYDFGSQSVTTLVDDSGGDIKSASYPFDVDDDGVIDVPFIEYSALHYYDTASSPPVATGDTVQVDSSTSANALGGSGDIGSDGVNDVVVNDADYQKFSDGTYVDANSENGDFDEIGDLEDFDADGSFEVPYVGKNGIGYFDYGLDSWVDLRSHDPGLTSDPVFTEDPIFMDISYFDSGKYTSKEYKPSNKVRWDNITIDRLSRSTGGSLDITVETSDDGFSTIKQNHTISNNSLSDGYDTYDLNELTEPASYVRIKFDFSSGSTASLDGFKIRGSENTVPTVNSVEFNNSNPEFGDSVNAVGNVTDEDGVSEVRFTVWERGTKIIDNKTGTDLGSGDWESPSFNVDEGPGYYNATVSYAEDTTGKSTTDSPEKSFYIDNTLPTINSVSFNNSSPEYGDTVFSNSSVSDEDGISEVRFDVWEGGTKIIDNQTGTQAASGFWHGPSFEIDEGSVYYNSSVSYAEDGKGRVNTSSPESSFYIENSPPRFNGSRVDDDRKANDLNFTLYIDDRNQSDISEYGGSGVLEEFTNQTLVLGKLMPITDSYNVTDKFGVSDSIQADISKSESSLRADDGTHNLSHQEVNKTITVSNSGDLWVEYSLEWLNYGSEVSGESWTGNVTPGSSKSHTGVWRGDWLKETEYNFTVPDQVYIGENYTGNRPLQVVEEKGVAWSNVDTSGSVSDAVDCSQSNGTALDVGSSSTKNYTIGFSCDPGSIDSTSLTVDNLSTGERVWYNGSFTVNNNLTDESTYVWKVDESNLKNPDNRDGGSLEGYADGNQINITTVDQGDEIWLYIGKEHTNSSWHTGSHDASVTYTLGASDDGGSSGGGGGGTGGTEETAVVFQDTLLKIAPDTKSSDSFSVKNRENTDGEVSFSIPAGGQCSRFSFSRDGSKSSTVQVSAANSLNLGSRNVEVWVDMPSESRLQQFDNQTISCQVQTSSGLGGTGELVLKAAPSSNPFQELMQNLDVKGLVFALTGNFWASVSVVLVAAFSLPFALRRFLN